MMQLVGRPMISHVLDRVLASETVDFVLLATTVAPADDVLEDWAASVGIKCYRGSEHDVLDRYYCAAKTCGATIITRVTADDPFKDPKVLDQVICYLKNEKLDFAYNNKPPSFPEGLDVEVFTFAALKEAAQNVRDPFEKEHMTQYFYRRPERFRQKNIACDRQLSHLRWTVDTDADFRMAKTVYERLYKKNRIFLMDEILDLIKTHPEIAKINANEVRSSMYL